MTNRRQRCPIGRIPDWQRSARRRVHDEGGALIGYRWASPLAGLFVIGAITTYAQIDTRSQYGGATAAVVDDKGNLRVPADYRTTYQMLGSRAVAKDDSPGSKEMHMVYASPGTIGSYPWPLA